MKLIDRYVLAQMFSPFAFFTLVFTGVIWLTLSLRQIDSVIDNGETAAVFLEFTLLLLPRVLVTILPLSAFGAAIYTLNKLYTESELVVMMMVGHNPNALLRPVLYFGILAASLMYALTLFLVPMSETQLSQRRFDINNELVRLFLREGEFVHPQKGVTLFIRDIAQNAEMAGIFINDQRDPEVTYTYTAERALLLSDGKNAQLALVDGRTLIYTRLTGTLDTLEFKQFTYDLAPFLEGRKNRKRRPAEYFLHQSMFPAESMLEESGHSRGEFIAQAHEYMSSPLFALITPSIALGAILFGGFRRGGFSLRIGFGVGIVAFVQILVVMSNTLIRTSPWLFPVAYLPAAIGFVIALLMLRFSSAYLVRSKKRAAAT